jgi:hypothetical protein
VSDPSLNKAVKENKLSSWIAVACVAMPQMWSEDEAERKIAGQTGLYYRLCKSTTCASHDNSAMKENLISPPNLFVVTLQQKREFTTFFF